MQKFFLFCIFQSKICFPACLLWSALVSVFVFHCLCFLCLYFFPIKDCLLSIVLKCSRLLSVSVKRRHPASLSSPQNIRRPNLFAINNEARSAAFVLCLYCFNFLFLLLHFLYILCYFVLRQLQPPITSGGQIYLDQQYGQILFSFFCVLTFCQIENLSISWSTISNWSNVRRKRWKVLLQMR